MFEPLRTERLVLRQPVAADADALFERRNDVEVGRYQSWSLPYPRERVDELIRSVTALPGPTSDDWWMATVCTATDDEIVGDIAVHLTWEGRSAEIGFTFARAHWGRGYAHEASSAMVAWLFEHNGATRVHAMTHPENDASGMLLERLGMLYEGRTRGSYWVGDECTDDVLYGMTRADWIEWVGRPRASPLDVRLVEITPETVRQVTGLATHWSQQRFVAPVLRSFAAALYPEPYDGAAVTPWLRAVEADGELVAFVMVALIPGHPPYLWRLSVDRMHQRRGIGDRILDLVIAQCRDWGASQLDVSWGEGRGSPRPFYERRGFVPTGRIVDDETEACLQLT